ncbi:hypothetical protein N7535_003579, partial [Penicillium sp. DV-2018c]
KGTQRREKTQKETSPGRLELPTSRLTVGRANQLRHGDVLVGETCTIWQYKANTLLATLSAVLGVNNVEFLDITAYESTDVRKWRISNLSVPSSAMMLSSHLEASSVTAIVS